MSLSHTHTLSHDWTIGMELQWNLSIYKGDRAKWLLYRGGLLIEVGGALGLY